MARESKRKRDERRFGRYELLADVLGVPGGPLVEATNVAEYYVRYMEEKGEMYIPDFIPNGRLPFPSAFIEMFRTNFGGCRVGWAFTEIDPRGDFATGAANGQITEWSLAVGGAMFMWRPDIGPMLADTKPLVQCAYHMDEMGRVLANPGFRVDDRFEFLARSQGVDVVRLASEALAPAMLAIAFMNCRNVVLGSTERDVVVNRERRKAGLKPFIRYHTIDIEPMKRVLRTEGNVEANGLKKALHIVRGHFAHYTEDKPLFGRPGLHGRFWMPSHVRGSLDQGAVVSDYRVKAPAGDG